MLIRMTRPRLEGQFAFHRNVVYNLPENAALQFIADGDAEAVTLENNKPPAYNRETVVQGKYETR